jgi:phage protein D
MSDKNLARRVELGIKINGADVTADMKRYNLSLTYTDKDEDETDDLQIKLQDASGIWRDSWLTEIVNAAAAKESENLSIQATITRLNWNGDGKDDLLDTGIFELDSVICDGPPSTVTIKATSLPFSAAIRQTLKSRAWEEYDLKGIASELASVNGMSCMFLSAQNPFYRRMEQFQVSDISFLQQLCHDAGCSLKATDKKLVIFDQADYEAKDPIITVKLNGGLYTRYKLSMSAPDAQYSSCRVYYNDPATGKCIEGVAVSEDYDSSKDAQQLVLYRKVGSIGEAQALAEKNLRLHNKFCRTVQFTLIGDTRLLAGTNILLADFGAWDGKYHITQAKHATGNGGYTVTVNARQVMADAPEEEEAEAQEEYNVGDVVEFHGGYHYVSSDASSPVGGVRTPGKAKVFAKNPGAAHPYSLIGGAYNELGGTCNVYGWVDLGTFS